MFTVAVLNPDGSTLASTAGFNTVSLVGQKLRLTGTYQVVIMPDNGSLTIASTANSHSGLCTCSPVAKR